MNNQQRLNELEKQAASLWKELSHQLRTGHWHNSGDVCKELSEVLTQRNFLDNLMESENPQGPPETYGAGNFEYNEESPFNG